jgi:exodeoxyribonuclease VII large subunit
VQQYTHDGSEERIAMLRQRLDDLSSRLAPAGERRLRQAMERMGALAGRLESLSPLKVLERGYSVMVKQDGKVVRSTGDVKPGEVVRTRVGDGNIVSRVE